MSEPQKKARTYKRIGERIKDGDYSSMIEPLDFLLIDTLPDEGTNLAGLYQIGETAASLVKKFEGPGITSALVGSRLTSLKSGGLCRSVNMVGGRGGHAWQKTALGKEVVEKWKANNSNL